MIKATLSLIILIISVTTGLCQKVINGNEYNMGFEKFSDGKKLPDGWFKWGRDYDLMVDNEITYKGKASVLIQPTTVKGQNSFGGVAYSIPSRFDAKEIEVRAFMKFKDVSEGPIGLLVRVEGSEGTLEVEDIHEKNIQGTSDWAAYSVKIPFPEDVRTIHIGALLSGKGQLWVDDFEVLLDGKDIREAEIRKGNAFKADSDKEFDKGSKILSINLNKSKVEDLKILGELWGYLKYYHPSIAAGEYNWDYELFRILPKVLEASTQKSRNKILKEWVSSLGKIKAETEDKSAPDEVTSNPDFSWLRQDVLGKDLVSELLIVKNAKRIHKNYYIGMADKVNTPIFKNEKSYANIKFPDQGYQLLSLYRYWNIINYYFPYKNLIEENWNEVLKEYIPKVLAVSSELEYKVTMLSLIARINDTHATVSDRDKQLENHQGLNSAPPIISFVQNKPVVTGYYDKSLGEISGLKVGDVIEGVNGKAIDEIIKEKLPLTPASNYPAKLRDIGHNLLRTSDTLMDISILRNNEKLTKQVKTYNYYDIKKNMNRDTCFKLINKDIAYLYPGSIKSDYLSKIIPEVVKSKGLIIDLRCYPSEFIVFTLGKYLLSEPTDFVKISTGSIISPGLFTMTKTLKVGKTNPDYYKGKVVIIINETTQSQAEYTTMALSTAPKATVIGSTTAGADGDFSKFSLPGGISTGISGTGIYYPDGRGTQRIGIIPDIEVKPTLKGVMEGKDELLEKAVQIIEEI